MLNAGQLLFDTGRVRNSTTVAPDDFSNGTPTTSGGLLSVLDGAPDHYHAGMPYGAADELAVDIGGAVAFFNQGIALTSAGRVVADTVGAVAGYVAGVPVTAAGALALAAAE